MVLWSIVYSNKRTIDGYWVRASEVLGWTPEFFEEEEEDELSVEDNNDDRINDLEANNGIDESDGRREYKMRSIDLSSVRSCWGNSNFDYVDSDSVVVLYAPHEAKEKAYVMGLFGSVVESMGWSNSRGCDPISLIEVLRFSDELLIREIAQMRYVHKLTAILNKIHQVCSKTISESRCIDTLFPVSLSIYQKEDMERRISKEESLHISFQRVVDAGLFMGIKINSMVNLSHLFYADDAIFLGQWSELNIDSLVRSFGLFFPGFWSTYYMYHIHYLGNESWGKYVKEASLERSGGQGVISFPRVLKSVNPILVGSLMARIRKSNKASWVKWNKVLTPKDKGGLGVSSLFALNRGLMLKWVWRFYSQKCSLWTKVIKAIYGLHPIEAGEWGEHAVLGRNLVMKDGVSTSVPTYVRFELNKNASISRMTTLMPCEDRYVWTLESNGVFSVASIRKEIDGNQFQDVSLPTRWVKSVPIKMNIIAWKVKSNALPTRFNISRRGMDIDSIVCLIGNAGVESTNHIFFQCVVVRQIMRKISSWWNIDYPDVNSYKEWRVWLVSIRIQSKLKGVLEGVYYGLWWYMWNFRNKLLFDKKIPEKALIFDNLTKKKLV
ncbi:RNA-directed DNA polymerase, eukaryota [Tanacetum coccineum]